MDTGAALLSRIREQPDDDALLLAYADYLDELDTARAPCPKCGGGKAVLADDHPEFGGRHEGWKECPACGGLGSAPDTSNRDRAELIRAQVGGYSGMACTNPYPYRTRLRCSRRWDDCTTAADREKYWCAVCFKTSREADIVAARAAEWRKGPACPTCDGTGNRAYGTWRQWDCAECWATGDAGGLAWRVFLDDAEDGLTALDLRKQCSVRYERGTKVVLCNFVNVCVYRHPPHGFDRVGPDAGADWSGRAGFPCACRWSSKRHGDACPEHGKTGNPVPVCVPTAWARAVCRHHPDVTHFRALDRRPNMTEYGYAWHRDQDHHASTDGIPTPVFDLIRLQGVGDYRVADTEQAARAALANALVRWVHAFSDPAEHDDPYR